MMASVEKALADWLKSKASLSGIAVYEGSDDEMRSAEGRFIVVSIPNAENKMGPLWVATAEFTVASPALSQTAANHRTLGQTLLGIVTEGASISGYFSGSGFSFGGWKFEGQREDQDDDKLKSTVIMTMGLVAG